MRLNRIVPILGAAIVLIAPSAQAQTCSTATSCTVNNDVTVTIAKMVKLTVAPSGTTPLTAPVPGDFVAGVAVKENLAATTLDVEANTGYTVTVHTSASNWTGPWSKPIADLEWQGGTVAGYQAISSTPVQFMSGSATSGDTESLDYSTSWSIADDVPGNYSLTLVFTAAAP